MLKHPRLFFILALSAVRFGSGDLAFSAIETIEWGFDIWLVPTVFFLIASLSFAREIGFNHLGAAFFFLFKMIIFFGVAANCYEPLLNHIYEANIRN